MKNICEGCCTDVKKSPNNCGVRQNYQQYKCPCPNCLIKMICKTSCEEMVTLWHSIIKK